jgi:surface polysaccharide O-acyltransferase-like enzyme
VPTSSPTSSPSRWLALDVFRALAVLWMIQGHTFTALLGDAEAFTGAWWQLYRMLHGLTAPMFLCGAGLAYGIVHFGSSKPVAPGRMLKRVVTLLVLGTILQLPAANLSAIWSDDSLLSSALQPAALQLIAACLALAELLRVLARRSFAALAAVLSAGVALSAPWLWQLQLSEQFLLGSWLDGHTGAQFPIAPWLGYFFLGAAISASWGARAWRERWRASLLGCAGLIASALCLALFLSGQRMHALYGQHPFWLTSPMLFGFRAGLVLAWLGALSAASRVIERGVAALPGVGRVISALSRHSLVAYVVHLWLLYGVPQLRTLHFSLLECSLICFGVLWLSVLSVLCWERAQLLAKLSSRPAPPVAVRRDPLA